MHDQKISINIDGKAKAWLADHGYDRAMGARPMERLFNDRLKKPLADLVLFGTQSADKNTRQVLVTVENGDITVNSNEDLLASSS